MYIKGNFSLHIARPKARSVLCVGQSNMTII
jgi:hypothetical protein